MSRDAKFYAIKDYFDTLDMRLIGEKGCSVWDTSHGLYGSSGLLDVYELFKTIRLGDRGAFVDLGSGDGRVAFVAALFTASTGIEGDAELHAHAEEAKGLLMEHVPELERCALTRGDYTKEDLSSYNTIFIYADHAWPAEFQEKLLDECRGTMFAHHNIYEPDRLKKGRTYWIHQVPFVSYPLNTDETF